MASREYYKKLKQGKINKILEHAESIKDEKIAKIEDTFPSEESAEQLLESTLRNIYQELYPKDCRSEKHYRAWLRNQGRNDKGVYQHLHHITDADDDLELQAKLAAVIHDEARLSYAKEVYESKPRSINFRAFIKDKLVGNPLERGESFGIYKSFHHESRLPILTNMLLACSTLIDSDFINDTGLDIEV